MSPIRFILIPLILSVPSVHSVGQTAEPVTNSIGMKLVRIKAGTFTMGQDGPPLEDYLRQKRFGEMHKDIDRIDFDRAACFEDLSTVGTLIVFGPDRDLFAAIRNFALFFQHESCGLCTPCRVGTTLLANYVKKFERGCGSPVDVSEMTNIAGLMKTMSHCGLGQTASNPITDSLSKFPGVWERRMKTTEFIPAFDLDWALEEARALTGRTDAQAHLLSEEA